ncbi:uncharacterized protein LOC132581843 [Heteronotia binoei]|uniref:uncharacterized protein LOC132581843 n=1 Tax=Heteronotia binoei TaxID=13085 RepID=UPI00292CA8A8|nr:uncharacterized protein LOC132581843 [Heteronotia binoei]
MEVAEASFWELYGGKEGNKSTSEMRHILPRWTRLTWEACGNQQLWAKDDSDVPRDEEIQEREEPWLVSILGNGERCQGAVLSNWWVLTAASCFLLMKPSYVELITTGGHISTITVSQFLSHRGFSSWARPPVNDMALVMLSQPIDLRSRDIWPVCVPDRKNTSLMLEHCRIHKRDQNDSKQRLERIGVYMLEMSECTTEWPGTSDEWNICMARKTNSESDCMVPVGSPVLCHDPDSGHWELRGIVSQSSTNCSSPILASQIIPHLEWLWEERILKNPVSPSLEYTENTHSIDVSLATEESLTTTRQSWDTFQTHEEEDTAHEEEETAHEEEETAHEEHATPLTEDPFDTSVETSLETAIETSLETPITTEQSPPTDVQLPAIFPFKGHIFGIPPTATKVQQSLSKVMTEATAGYSEPVDLIVQPSASATNSTIFIAYPTAKRLSPVTSSQIKLPVISTVTKSPVTSTKTNSPVISTVTKSPVTSTKTNSPVISTVTKSPVTSTRTNSPVISTVTKSPVTSTRTKSSVTSTKTKPPVKSKRTKSPVTSKRTKSPITSTTIKSPVTSTVIKSPVTTTTTKLPVTTTTTKLPETPTRRESPPQTSTLRAAKIIILARSTVKKSPTTRRTSTTASSKAYMTTNKQPYVISSKKHLSHIIIRPLAKKSTRITPTTSHSTSTVLAVMHLQHVIVIPATTRTSLTSPVSKKVPPVDPPSPKPTVEMSLASPFIATRPHFPKNKFEETMTPTPPLALFTSPNAAVPTTPLFLPRVRMTMEQCEMALEWNSVSQTYQLNKMADLMGHKIGCGLRPGFLAHCPGCLEAEAGEFPWVVSLTLSIQHFCAGSILNPWWILTTANCANLIKDSEALVLVQAGLVDLSEGTGSVPVRQALTHPDALANKDLHNLGLLQLQKPLEFGPHVAPVCISDTAHVMDDFRDCWLPSWTVLQGGPTRLLRRPLTILSVSSCSRPEEKLSKAVFCIKAQKDQGQSCKGDVGSPLICPDPKGGAWVQLGVLSSFDEACARPYVFNSLQRYLPWLEKTTRDQGRSDNYTVSWQRQGSALQLRLLREPEALAKWISADSALAWQALVATCGNRSCGGSILDRYWVLTTAQCVRDTNPADTAVFVGLTHPKGQAQGILVAGIYPYEGTPQSNISGGTVALLLLRDPIAFGKYVTPMALPQTATWDSCRVLGLQTWKPGEAEPDPTAYQAKVLLASDCAIKHPGVNPAVFCIERNSFHYLPVATVGEGAALLCHSEATTPPWSQAGLTSEPFPGSQPDILSSSIAPYVEWMEKTSQEARNLLSLSRGRRTARRPHWALLLTLSLLGETALG